MYKILIFLIKISSIDKLGLIKSIAKIYKYDLFDMLYKQIGVSNYGDIHATGEFWLITNVLKNYIHTKHIVIFDIGANPANGGEYLHQLIYTFPQAKIYAFEPNINSFKKLNEMFPPSNKQINEPLAIGSKLGKTKLYIYDKDKYSELGTGNKDVLIKHFKIADKIRGIFVKSITLDEYCHNHSITRIDFLKIDVEGGELKVLLGAKQILASKKISIIQFEFNVHNIYNHCFLHDFYTLLPKYNFYRLKDGILIKLGKYSPDNEIFRYQNIIALKDKLCE